MKNELDPAIPGYLMNDLLRMMTRIGANEHWYEQTWMGVPIWQIPGDLLRLQEVIFDIQPTWIVETGTKFGGSAIFFSSLLKLIGKNGGGVITVDLTQYAEAVATFSSHPHADLVKAAIVGDAASPSVVNQVKEVLGGTNGRVVVFLDDNHNAEHVLTEMNSYAELVTPGSYLIVADTVFEDLAGTPVGTPTSKYPDVANSNPRVAVNRFLAMRKDFIRDDRFVGKGMSNFADGFLRKLG